MASRAPLALLAAAALLAVAAACGGAAGDKAGGGSSRKPLVLRLESEDDVTLTGAPEFASAVEKLSAGSIRIRLVPAGRSTEIEFERGVVEDVRSGRAELGLVGVRVWDTLGVTSFQALLAPLLVDSFELERRVLESPLAERMLAGVERASVVGVALLPGPLRRPFGVTGALVRAEDYRGATIGVRPSGVARTAVRALGATPVGHVPGDLTGADGAELDLTTIRYNDFHRQSVTANVVLWPKPFSVVMNRAAFAALSDDQRGLLRLAGREALAPELRQIERDEARAAAELCNRLSFVTASASDLAGLRAALRPVYTGLEQDAETKELLAAIRALGGKASGAAPVAPGCRVRSSATKSDSSAIQGTWETTWIRARLEAAGIAREDAIALSGHHTVEFRDGRFHFTGDPGSGKSAVGTYTVAGDVLRLVFETGVALQVGRTYELRWSVYRDALTFSAVSGSETLKAFLTAPYTRVR